MCRSATWHSSSSCRLRLFSTSWHRCAFLAHFCLALSVLISKDGIKHVCGVDDMSRQLLAIITVGTHYAQSRMLSTLCLPAVLLKSALESLCNQAVAVPCRFFGCHTPFASPPEGPTCALGSLQNLDPLSPWSPCARMYYGVPSCFLSALDILVFTCLTCLHCLIQNTVHVAADDLGQEICRHTGPGGRLS